MQLSTGGVTWQTKNILTFSDKEAMPGTHGENSTRKFGPTSAEQTSTEPTSTKSSSGELTSAGQTSAEPTWAEHYSRTCWERRCPENTSEIVQFIRTMGREIEEWQPSVRGGQWSDAPCGQAHIRSGAHGY